MASTASRKYRAGERKHFPGSTALIGVLACLSPAPLSPALAQQADVVPAAVAANSQRLAFDIPPQPLAGAIVAFSRRAGVDVIFDGALTEGLRTPGVVGTFTPPEALRRLLAGTGLSVQQSGGRTLKLLRPDAGPAAGAAPDDAVALDTITVSSGASAQDQPFQTPGSSSYISQEQMERIPPSSTGDMFRNAPGVISAGNRNGASINLNIRGLQGANRVNVMVDGTQQNSSSYRGYGGHDNRVYVDPELIGGISIEKGPSGGPYGAGAMGGVVNMRTLEAADILKDAKEWGVRARGSLGNNAVDPPPVNTSAPRTGGSDDIGTDNAIGSIAGAVAKDNVELVLAYARRKSGNYFAGTNGPTTTTISGQPVSISPYKHGEEVYNTSVDTKSALAKGKFTFAEDHTLELGYIYFDSYYGEAWPDLIRFGIKQQSLPAHTRTNTYTARYAYTPSDNPLVDFHLNMWAAETETNLQPLYTTNDSFTKGGEAWNTSRLDTALGALSVKYGVSYAREDFQSEEIIGSSSMDGERTLTSAFTETALDITSWLQVAGTVRYDNYQIDGVGNANLNNPNGDQPFSSDGGRVSPTASVTITPWEGIQFYGLYANGWRPPTLREIIGVTGYITPNPNLRPETASNFEFGINVDRDGVLAADDKLRVKLAYFDNDYTDYIVRSPAVLNGVPGSYTWANIPKAYFKGVEAQLSYDVGYFFTEMNFTYYTDVTYCFTDSRDAPACHGRTSAYDYGSSFVPPKYAGSVTVGGRFFDEALTLGTRVSFAGARAADGAVLSTSLPYVWAPYTVVDVFGKYEFTEDVVWNFSVENIGDRYYVDALGNSYMPAPGRTFRTGMTIQF